MIKINIKIFTIVRSMLIMFLFSLCISAMSQSDTIQIVAAEQPVAKSEHIDFRIPDESKIDHYKKDSRFNYTVEEKGLSRWDVIKYRISHFINEMFYSVGQSGVMGVVVILVIVLILGLIIMKLFGVNFRTLMGKKEIDASEIDIYTENVHEMDFDALIANALKNKDYRLVIRFAYLKNLKQLSDKDIINWSANKTNYSYQYEINDNMLRSKFLETTLIFDYVWYGEFSVSEEQFSDIYTRMNSLNSMIK